LTRRSTLAPMTWERAEGEEGESGRGRVGGREVDGERRGEKREGKEKGEREVRKRGEEGEGRERGRENREGEREGEKREGGGRWQWRCASTPRLRRSTFLVNTSLG
jgi:hypothetical protein